MVGERQNAYAAVSATAVMKIGQRLGEDHAVVDPDLGIHRDDRRRRRSRRRHRRGGGRADPTTTIVATPSIDDARRCAVTPSIPIDDHSARYDRVERRMARARLLAAVEEPADGIDEPRALGQRVRLPVVVEGVPPEPVPVVPGDVGGGPPPQHVHDPDREADHGEARRATPRSDGSRRRRVRVSSVDRRDRARARDRRRGHGAAISTGARCDRGVARVGVSVGRVGGARPEVSPDRVETDGRQDGQHGVDRGAVARDPEARARP